MSLEVTAVCGMCGSKEEGLAPLKFSTVIFDDGTVQCFEECKRCGYLYVYYHQYPYVKEGVAYHRHHGFGLHPVSQKHRQRTPMEG